MCAEDTGADRYRGDCKCNRVQACGEGEGSVGLHPGGFAKALVPEYRFEYINHQRKGKPNRYHQVQPPERRIAEAVPRIERIQHIKTGKPGNQNRDAGLPGEPSLECLESFDRLRGVVQLPGMRQHDRGHNGDTADPMHDRKHMNRASQCQSVDGHASLVRGRAGARNVAPLGPPDISTVENIQTARVRHKQVAPPRRSPFGYSFRGWQSSSVSQRLSPNRISQRPGAAKICNFWWSGWKSGEACRVQLDSRCRFPPYALLRSSRA